MYMRKTQILKVNHHFKKGVTIAKDTDTNLLNEDKNSETIKTNHKSTKNQMNHSIKQEKILRFTEQKRS